MEKRLLIKALKHMAKSDATESKQVQYRCGEADRVREKRRGPWGGREHIFKGKTAAQLW